MYDFDTVIDRSNTGSIKWEPSTLKEMFGREDALPFWIADMDFKCPPKLIDTMEKRAAHGIYGYTGRYGGYLESVVGWMRRRHNYEIEKEWIVFTPGVVPAVNIALNAFCEKGDKIIIQEPVYYPFANSIRSNHMEVLNNELIYKDGKHHIDFDNLRALASDPKAKMLILCSPHNPGGKVFTKEELQKIGEICLENDVLIVDDEIHNDLVFEKDAHTVMATISKDIENISIVCTAPSKSFNVAGLYTSHIIIANETLRKKFTGVIERFHISGQTPFGIESVKVLYNECEDWLDELLIYLKGNADFMDSWLKSNLPQVKLMKPEATYLAWFDFTYYLNKGIDPYEIVIDRAGVGYHRGTMFGDAGKGFMRVCFGCPRSIIEEGFVRMKQEFDKL